MTDRLYQEELLEHYKYPKHRKVFEDPDFSADDYNPSCGDRISIQGMICNGIITDVGFGGSGCVISQATASMLAESCIGKTVTEVGAMTSQDIINMIKIPLGPTRLKCALLSLYVLQHALKIFEQAAAKKGTK